MNIISMFKKLVLLSSISLAIASHAQAATFADASTSSAMTDVYQPTLSINSSDAYTHQVSDDSIVAAEGFENTPELVTFNLDASSQGRSFSMLLAGLSMMTFIVLRRRIKL